jgi:very-short-patch-repair endonuclease
MGEGGSRETGRTGREAGRTGREAGRTGREAGRTGREAGRASVRPTPFRGTEALAAGRLTRARLYGPRYRRVYPDVYLPAGPEPDLATLSRAAFLLVADRGGVLAGYSAAALLGADCASPGAPAEVLVATNSRPHPRLRIRRGRASGADLTVVEGVRVTSPSRTAWDLARRLPVVDAVVALDALARVGGFAPADLLARASAEPRSRGVRRLADVVAQADPRAESPPETRLRLLLRGAGLPVPEVQYQVRDEYGFVLARVDLAYPAARLAIEYDGSGHLDPRRTLRDRQRDLELADLGWDTMRLGQDDLDTPPQTAHRVARRLEQRAALWGPARE